jgi:hypothetical protein
MEIKIKVEVHALLLAGTYYEQPQYRLYVNDDLITERKWIWDINTIIEENLTVDLPPNEYHNIRVEAIHLSNYERWCGSQLALRNLNINDIFADIIDENRSELSFLLDEHKYTKPVETYEN